GDDADAHGHTLGRHHRQRRPADARGGLLACGEHRGPRLLCAVPVFAPGMSATENSLIGTGDSLLVENNYGYTGPASVMNGATTEPGVTRIDVHADGDCGVRWTSSERVPSTVSKMSLADGLMYAYTKDP